jgi:hypothetical protein
MPPRKSLESKEIYTFVTRRPARCAALLLALLGVPAAAQEQAPTGSVVIVQESNGFPGGEKARLLSRQKVSVLDGRLRVLDPNNGWALFVSLPERLVREASLGRGEYEERGFEHYERYRDDLQRSREKAKEQFLRLRGRASGDAAKLAEIEAEYRKAGGDPAEPGRLQVTIEHRAADQRKETVLVDLEPREVTLEHYLVRENQQEHPTLDLWVAPGLDLGVDLLAFWRALVPFPPEVSAKMGEIRGGVLHLEATVDTGTFRRGFRTRILELRTPACEQVVADELRLPARWKKIDPKAAREAAESHVCVMTGERLALAELARFDDPATRRTYWVKKELRGELIKLLAKRGRPPHADAEGRED